MLLIGFVLLMGAAAPWMLSRYVGRLPVAPQCPHCRTVTVTAGIQASGALGRAYQALTSSVVRSCTRCGWAGRMRWRPAPVRMRGQP